MNVNSWLRVTGRSTVGVAMIPALAAAMLAALVVAPAGAQAPPAGESPLAEHQAEIFVDATAAAGIDAPHRGTWDEFTGKAFAHGYLGTGQAWGRLRANRLRTGCAAGVAADVAYWRGDRGKRGGSALGTAP